MQVAGIDFSSHAVDIVTIDVDGTAEPTWHRYVLDGQDAFDRARTVRGNVPGPWNNFWDDILAIGIEEPQMRGSSMATAYALYRVQGAVLACLPPSILVHPLRPASWRAAVGLAGNATKQDVARHSDFLRAPGTSDWPQDAHDAHLIAFATRAAIVPGEAAA